MTITALDQLPKNNAGEYKRDDAKVYYITLDNREYKFYNNGIVVV